LSLTDDLYRDIILEHFKSPRNQGRIDPADILTQGTNPFCGDELELTLRLEAGRISDIKAQSKGCSISQASVSMMTEAVKGKTLQEADDLIKRFKATMLENAPWVPSEETEDLEALEGVKKYPVRIKCAILSWNTLHEGIQAHHKGKSQATHVEGEEGDRPDLALQMEATAAPEPQEAAPAPSTQDQVREAGGVIRVQVGDYNVLDIAQATLLGQDLWNGVTTIDQDVLVDQSGRIAKGVREHGSGTEKFDYHLYSPVSALLSSHSCLSNSRSSTSSR